jgi:putative ABC transport system substrate-binding protein
MKRRQFIFTSATLAVLSGCGLVPGTASRPGQRPARIGVLGSANSQVSDEQIAGLKQGLVDLGYVEGQTIAYERRQASSGAEIPDLAHQLAQLPVDVFVAAGSPAALAVRQVTTDIPIVFMNVTDPVGQGLVDSLAHPGGNVTGITNTPASVSGKRLELLSKLLPGLSRVALFAGFDTANAPSSTLKLQFATSVARAVGVQLKTLEVNGPDDVEPALAEALSWPAQSMLVFSGPIAIIDAIPRFVEVQTQNRIPVVFDASVDGQTRGGLMSYGVSNNEQGRLAANLVDKIQKGTRPADLPVQEPTVFEFVVNQTVAQALGIGIPPDIAQEVNHWDQ